jgi:hypothetical protein
MKELIIAGIAALMMTGCSDRYRYPCQDPTNWDTQECKKPFCSADGTCPEDLKHYEKETSAPAPAKIPSKGECK